MLANGLSNESNVGIDYKNNPNQGYKKIFEETNPNAVLSSSHSTVIISKYGQAPFYLPQKSEESTFGLSIETIAYRKGFQYKQQFDKM